MNTNNEFYNNLNCETAIVLEEIKWSVDREPKPKAKVRIPILMPLEKSIDAPNTQIKSINNDGGKSISGISTTYTTSNYITLDIPTYLFPEPISVMENGRQVRYSIIPKGTELITVFIGKYIRLNMIRVISITL